MQEKIRFQKNVASDLDRILEAYESKSAITANKVRDELANTLEYISMFPEMYAVVDDDIRLVKTKNYPLLIQYCIVEGIPVVLSVFVSGLEDKLKRQ